jgi:protein disulfide-isomerase A4
LLSQGRAFEYNGPREKANIVQFMRVQQQPPSLEVSTASALTNSLDRLEATVLGLFNGRSDLYEEFMVAANEMRGSYRYHGTATKRSIT